jgi:hypothetical protein
MFELLYYKRPRSKQGLIWIFSEPSTCVRPGNEAELAAGTLILG